VFVERLWCSIKYEEIYLQAHETPREVDAALTRYCNFYNGQRPHQSLEQRTPDAVYFAVSELSQAANSRGNHLAQSPTGNEGSAPDGPSAILQSQR
jgi:putative transposase